MILKLLCPHRSTPMGMNIRLTVIVLSLQDKRFVKIP